MSELWTFIYPKELFLSLQHWQPAGLLGATWIKPSLFTLALLLNNHYLP